MVSLYCIASTRRDFNARLYKLENYFATKSVLTALQYQEISRPIELTTLAKSISLETQLPESSIQVVLSNDQLTISTELTEPKLLPLARMMFGKTPAGKVEVTAGKNSNGTITVTKAVPFTLGIRKYESEL